MTPTRIRECPSLAGFVNLAGHFYGGSAAELSTIYQDMNMVHNYATDFRDITSGKTARYKAGTGWDFVTGAGSTQNLLGK